jgi:formate C-acetyltransferase
VQPRWGNSPPLQLDLDSSLAHTLGGFDSIVALIRTHNDIGGTLINLNVIFREQLLEAHAAPEAYPDLVVHITGYSAYFRSLSKEYRQQVVDRMLAANARVCLRHGAFLRTAWQRQDIGRISGVPT